MVSRTECANAIRVLAMDAVQKANSGHPGMPMGMADIAEILWRDYLKHCPQNPDWINRDRFIVSNGHGAMLLYALLHLAGYSVSIEDLRQFRQWHSKTPGHPEYADTPGVETTTGPLGQGLANGVGMALAEKMLAATFNQPDFEMIDHYTYVFVGDGCLMEGISHEVCSLAGTWGLEKLIVFYDDNGISIDGAVDQWFRDDTAKRFEAYGWQVISPVDGHNAEQIKQAIEKARANTQQPSLIICKTHIGFGAPNKVGTAEVHGSPLGDEEIALVRKALHWPHPPFEIPADIYQAWDAKEKGYQAEKNWLEKFEHYVEKYPVLANDLERRIEHRLPEGFISAFVEFIQRCQTQHDNMATRKASQQVLNFIGPHLPELMGGSADLTGSNNTDWKGSQAISPRSFKGNYIYYGVREFGMSAIMNGLALHKGFIPYGGTFLTFSDYARNAVRLSALMKQRVIYIYSHDSIGLGEDGPTHQPIEHIASLRLIPHLHIWRPCDVVEVAVAWKQAIEYQGPTCLLLTRQNLSYQHRDEKQLMDVQRGGYILYDENETPNGIIIATGSEVYLAMEAAKQLKAENFHIRVVSMPCCETFKEQDASYQEKVLPIAVKARLAVEAGVSNYWIQFVGDRGGVIGIDQFGASAPAKILFEKFGFTVDNVANAMRNLL